jgi:trimeric autotransporter adhesin
MNRRSVCFAAVVGIGAMGWTVLPAVAAPQEGAKTVVAEPSSHFANAPASVPRLVQFSGTLKDTAARSVSGVASVTFAIYAEQDGGTALWSETQNVLADANGHFSVLLGAATSTGVPPELFGTGQSRWLGVTVARQQEMPRVLLASVPYALRAADADTLGGLPASAFVTKTATMPGSTAILTAPQISAESGNGTATSAGLPQATPSGGGTTNFIPIWTSVSALGNSIMFQTAGNVGIGTNTPAETLDVNGNSIFRGSFQLPPGHPATSASGFESHSFQFQASSFNSGTATSNTEAFGFRAEPLNNNTTNPSAKLDLFFGAGGSAPFTDTGLSFAANGVITFASGQTFPSQSANVNELVLPNTTSATSGVITVGGVPFLSDFGSPTNTFVGGNVGLFTANSFANQNTGVGDLALQELTTGSSNTAVGEQALQALTTGAANTGIGIGALHETQTAGFNTAIGDQALAFNTTGETDSSIGYQSGVNSATGSQDTFLGAFSGVTADGINLSTAVGYGAQVGVSNALVLGGTGTFAVNVGIGTPTPTATLDIRSGAGDTLATPSPVISLTNLNTLNTPTVAINFNPSPPPAAVPAAQLLVVGSGAGGEFQFKARNTSGVLINTFTVDNFGNAQLPGELTVDIVSKSSGNFKIDDPIDPGGKYLRHSFVESPDMMNIYNGNVTTNAEGLAVVEMPAWFEALNRDFRYQLTVIGQFAQAIVGSEMADRKFSIRTDKGNVKVSWQVTGIRQDAWANAHRIPTEEVKPPIEQGHYLHPELFGAPPEKSIAAAHAAAAASGENAQTGATSAAQADSESSEAAGAE